MVSRPHLNVAAPDSAGTVQIPDDIGRWRKAERARLIDSRMSLPAESRQRLSERIAVRLRDAIGDVSGQVVSAYWPFRGEPDLRVLMEILVADGARTALPVVVTPKRPLVFREWKSGDPLEKGIWNIPVPSEGTDVRPDIVIAPVVGFDSGRYRLGYGGGFYDRTIAALPDRPRLLGVGFAIARVPTIFPQAHDIPMDVIVTEDGPAVEQVST